MAYLTCFDKRPLPAKFFITLCATEITRRLFFMVHNIMGDEHIFTISLQFTPFP